MIFSEVLKESSEDKSRNTKKRGTKNSDEVQKSISDQTVQAALQFGVLVRDSQIWYINSNNVTYTIIKFGI